MKSKKASVENLLQNLEEIKQAYQLGGAAGWLRLGELLDIAWVLPEKEEEDEAERCH